LQGWYEFDLDLRTTDASIKIFCTVSAIDFRTLFQVQTAGQHPILSAFPCCEFRTGCCVVQQDMGSQDADKF
jgi:hypothetical protein